MSLDIRSEFYSQKLPVQLNDLTTHVVKVLIQPSPLNNKLTYVQNIHWAKSEKEALLVTDALNKALKRSSSVFDHTNRRLRVVESFAGVDAVPEIIDVDCFEVGFMKDSIRETLKLYGAYSLDDLRVDCMTIWQSLINDWPTYTNVTAWKVENFNAAINDMVKDGLIELKDELFQLV